MDDDSKKKSENLPPEESFRERDRAERSPSSPLSQHSSTQNLVIEDGGNLSTTTHSLSPKSLQELKLKLKKRFFGDDYDSVELETSGDEQDNAVVSVKKELSPDRSSSTTLEELKLKLKRDLFGEDYDSHDYDTTEDEDSISTTITTETAVMSIHCGDCRETTPSSSAAKQPEETDRETSPLPEKITPAEATAENLAKKTKSSSTDGAQLTSPPDQEDK